MTTSSVTEQRPRMRFDDAESTWEVPFVIDEARHSIADHLAIAETALSALGLSDRMRTVNTDDELDHFIEQHPKSPDWEQFAAPSIRNGFHEGRFVVGVARLTGVELKALNDTMGEISSVTYNQDLASGIDPKAGVRANMQQGEHSFPAFEIHNAWPTE